MLRLRHKKRTVQDYEPDCAHATLKDAGGQPAALDAPGGDTEAAGKRRHGHLYKLVRGVLLPIAWMLAVGGIGIAVESLSRPILGDWYLVLIYEPIELILSLITLKLVGRPRETKIKLTRKASAKLIALVLLVIMIPAHAMSSSLTIQSPVADTAGSIGLGVTLVSALLMAPIVEEAMFRGVMYGMSRRVMGFWPSAIINAVLFWLLHGDLPRALSTIPLALICEAIYEETGSLRYGMWIHFLGNLESIVLNGVMPVMLALPLYIASLAVLIAMCRKRDRLIAWVSKPRKSDA